MQIKVPPGNNGDLQETREHRLMAFAAAGIEKLPGTNDDTPATILAVARSAESPLAKALVALRPMLAANKVKVRLVFSNDDATLDPFFAGIADDAAAPLAEVRILRDPRLRDAHEQLIVGHMSVWFGDSLRRDIHRRDLFEQFHADAPEAARSAAHGFERLWTRTEPCLALPALAADSLTAMPPRKPGNAGPTGTVLC